MGSNPTRCANKKDGFCRPFYCNEGIRTVKSDSPVDCWAPVRKLVYPFFAKQKQTNPTRCANKKGRLWAAQHGDLSPARASDDAHQRPKTSQSGRIPRFLPRWITACHPLSGACGSFERGIFWIDEYNKVPQADACGNVFAKYSRKRADQNR